MQSQVEVDNPIDIPIPDDRTLLRQKLFRILFSLFIACVGFPKSVQGESVDTQLHAAVPWFTGTLLSTRGRTLDPGHLVVQPYVFYTRYGGLYNDIGASIQLPGPARSFNKRSSSTASRTGWISGSHRSGLTMLRKVTLSPGLATCHSNSVSRY